MWIDIIAEIAIACLIFWAAWTLVTRFVTIDPFRTVALVILYVVAGIYLIHICVFLLHSANTSHGHWLRF